MQQTISLESLSSLLRSTYESTNKELIKKSSETMLRLLDYQPVPIIQMLISIIEHTQDGSITPQSIPLRNSASVHLKNAIFKFIWSLQNQKDQQKQQMLASLAEKLYSLLNAPSLLSKTSREMLSLGLAAICKSSQSINDQLTSQLLTLMTISNDPHILKSMKELCVALIRDGEGTQQMISLVNRVLPVLKKLLAKLYQQIKQPDQIEAGLQVAQECFDLLDIALQEASKDQELFGNTLHRLKQDAEWSQIFIKYLEIGFESSNSVVLTQKATFQFRKINHVKVLVFHAMEKIYVIDPPPIINLCLRTVLSCESNYFPSNKHIDQQIYIRCFELLNKNADFNQNYMYFNLHVVHLLLKCVILCKSTPDELASIEQEPEKFVETTEDFCDRREEESIRMKSAELLKTLIKRIDGALGSLKTICYDLIRSVYSNRQPFSNLSQTQIFASTKTVKVEVSLLILALIYDNLKESVDSVIELKAFLLEMIQPFNEETEPLIQLRIINLIGYCLDINYLPLIITRMQESPKAVKYQVFSTLNRILRHKNLDPIVYQYLAATFTSQIQVLDVQSYLFQTIVICNYSKLLADFPVLKQACINKVIQGMGKVASTCCIDPREHVPFNLFSHMITIETDQSKVQDLENKFLAILRTPSRRQTTETNILEIMILFLNKLQKASQTHQDFVTFIEENLYEYYQSREAFLYLNNFVYWHSSSHQLYNLIHSFLTMKMRSKDYFIGPIAIITGLIVYKHPRIPQFQKLIEEVLTYYPQCTVDSTKGRLLNVINQGVISNSEKTLAILGEQKYLFVVKEMISHASYFASSIDRKICIISVCKLLKLEADSKQSNVDMLMFVADLLALQYKQLAPKSTPLYFNYPAEEENAIQEEAIQQNAIMSTHDEGSFDSEFYQKFLHPLQAADEFAIFNQIWQQVKNIYVDQLNPVQTRAIRGALEVRKVQQKTRRIVKVKNPQLNTE